MDTHRPAPDHHRHPRHGRRRRRRAGGVDRRCRRARRLHRADDLGAGRRAAHRRDQLLRRAVSQARRQGQLAGAGAGADADAGRRRHRDRVGADGGRPRRAARARHARPHHLHRLDQPRLFDDRADRAGRRPRRFRGAARRLQGRRQAHHPRRHGATGRSDRQRDLGRAVRRARRRQGAADAAHGVRGGDPSRRRRRQGKHRGVRRGLCRGRRRAAAGQGSRRRSSRISLLPSRR